MLHHKLGSVLHPPYLYQSNSHLTSECMAGGLVLTDYWPYGPTFFYCSQPLWTIGPDLQLPDFRKLTFRTSQLCRLGSGLPLLLQIAFAPESRGPTSCARLAEKRKFSSTRGWLFGCVNTLATPDDFTQAREHFDVSDPCKRAGRGRT